MKKQVGAFDGAAELLEDTFGQWVGNRFDKQVRLAARLLRVAGRADIIGDEQDELCLYDIIKIARIIHWAQKYVDDIERKILAEE